MSKWRRYGRGGRREEREVEERRLGWEREELEDCQNKNLREEMRDEDKEELTYLQILHLIEGDDSSLFYFPGVEVNWSSFCSYVAINIIANSPSNKYDINDNIQIKIS